MTARREFLAAAGTGLLAAALGARAQREPFRVGWISPATLREGLQFLDALRQGLRELGHVEGGNLMIEARWGDNSTARIDALAAELVAWKPHVIVTLGPTAYAVRRATSAIPVVFGFSGDPVKAGFVASLSRPGGNLTGMSFMALELAAKRVELLKTVMPALKRIAILASAQHPGDEAERQVSEAAARPLGLEIEFFDIGGGRRLSDMLDAIRQSRCEAAVMFPIQSVVSNSEQIAAWSVRSRIPAISGWAQFAEEGNLMSYGANLREAFRRLATYVDRILKGARPIELPVELPLQVEFVLNLKAAKALGVNVPQSVLLRADRVID